MEARLFLSSLAKSEVMFGSCRQSCPARGGWKVFLGVVVPHKFVKAFSISFAMKTTPELAACIRRELVSWQQRRRWAFQCVLH